MVPLKYALILVALILSYQFLDRFVESQTHKFTLCGISSRLEYNPAWATPPPTSEELTALTSLFNQKFTFLNSGGQSFVFLSEDGNYVLKFFKLYRRRLLDGVMYCPLPPALEKWRQKKVAPKRAKLERDFNSYMLAFRELREESGLIFLHLNKTDDLKIQVTIVDALGIEHIIALDEKEFLLQKRVTLAHDAIDALMREGRIEEVKERITSLLQLTIARYKKGIFDDDAVISKNYGFEGDRAIFLDIGRFQKKPEYRETEHFIRDLELITGRFRGWLEKNHPALVPYLEAKRGELCYGN